MSHCFWLKSVSNSSQSRGIRPKSFWEQLCEAWGYPRPGDVRKRVPLLGSCQQVRCWTEEARRQGHLAHLRTGGKGFETQVILVCRKIVLIGVLRTLTNWKWDFLENKISRIRHTLISIFNLFCFDRKTLCPKEGLYPNSGIQLVYFTLLGPSRKDLDACRKGNHIRHRRRWHQGGR